MTTLSNPRLLALSCAIAVACGGETQAIETQVFSEPTERPPELGALPEADFDRLTLLATGGMPSSSGKVVDKEYVVDAELGYLWWRDHEDRDFRFLTVSEFEAVLAAYAAITVSSSENCGADKPLVTLEVENGGTSVVYVDDFYSCPQRIPDGVYVQNIDGLYHLLIDLA